VGVGSGLVITRSLCKNIKCANTRTLVIILAIMLAIMLASKYKLASGGLGPGVVITVGVGSGLVAGSYCGIRFGSGYIHWVWVW
jgi:hypothetical protein